MTGISLSLPLSLLARLPQFLNPSGEETLAVADPTTEAVAAAGREDDESPVLVASHGVVERGFDRGSRGYAWHGGEQGHGQTTRSASGRVSSLLPPWFRGAPCL